VAVAVVVLESSLPHITGLMDRDRRNDALKTSAMRDVRRRALHFFELKATDQKKI
jgi:hypothetical protein